MAQRHGGKILVDQLAIQGVERVFSVPGESFLAALDGLYESGIENIVCRHEGGAAMMAEAHGKLTGSPGVLFVTRGPGATNASSGIHVARQDSTPLVMFVGQIARGHRDREAFQEVDYRAMFAPLAKWVAEVEQTERLPEYIARAFQIAQSGRPGPVVLALPEDMLSAVADVPDHAACKPARAEASGGQIADVVGLLQQARRPMVIAGGSGWSQEASEDLRRFARNFDLPVAVSFRRQDYIPNDDRHYIGDLSVGMNPDLAECLKQSDLLLVLGSRLGDIATDGYTLIEPAAPKKLICHIHPDPDELGHIYRPDLAINAAAPSTVKLLAEVSAPEDIVWSRWREAARAAYQTWQEPEPTPGTVHMEQIVPFLSETLPQDAILTNGAGNYAAFLHRYFRYKVFGTQLAPTSGSMGYGFPAAIAAKLEHPDKLVICFAGDGCFQMTLNELSTAVQHGANVIVIVVNNGKYGTIRMHQERHYPGRISGTELASPDFAALARAYGGFGATVERTEDFAEAFAQAQSSGSVSVIELVLNDEVLSTRLTLSQTRALGETSAEV